ncbi:MAG: SDR family NAD(P)-dependent oxidoreductase [Pseudomonadota bacterium]
MNKTILITGSTDGIGLETAKSLAKNGHNILLHGRSPAKLAAAEEAVNNYAPGANTETYVADLSRIADVTALADAVRANHDSLDILINNAGVFRTPNPITHDDMDVRFVVNTIAPYLLTQQLRPLMGAGARVINLSSAAQSSVDYKALSGEYKIDNEFEAYGQSKLAITMWSAHLATSFGAEGPLVVAVNPGSLLATKMVKEGFGMPGNDIGIGSDILVRAALSDEFANASGRFFDNDSGQFASPHPDALDPEKNAALVEKIEYVLESMQSS